MTMSFPQLQPFLKQYLRSWSRQSIRSQRRWTSNAPSETIAQGPGSAGAAQSSGAISGKRQSRFSRAFEQMKRKPGTHVTSFLILHEITAVAPLVPLYYFFQWTGLSASFLGGPMVGTIGQTSIPSLVPSVGGRKVEDVATEWIDEIARTVARVGTRYGIMGFHKVQQLRGKEQKIVEDEGAQAVKRGLLGDISGSFRGKVSETVSGVSIRNVMDGVAAYAIVKAILPFRLALSIAGTPWFASRIIGPIIGTFKRAPKTA